MEGHLSEEQLEAARAAVPIVCVDIVPSRTTVDDHLEVGLILREMPGRDSQVWCHLGGRVRRGETLRSSLLRHLRDTLHGADVDLTDDPQPAYVMQWFPDAGPADDRRVHGHDPRQHAVALVYAVELRGEPEPRAGGEASEFRWWRLDDLVRGGPPLWPGCLATITGALDGSGREVGPPARSGREPLRRERPGRA